jgi:DNA polymerase III epsilon subunit-like protein
MIKFLFLDIETTGFNPDYDFITQIAGILTDENGKALKVENFYLKLPEGELMPSKAMRLTGITDELLAEKGVTMEEAAVKLNALVDDETVVVAHYAPFDLHFIEHYFSNALDFICTRTMSYYLRPGKKASLRDVCVAYGVVNENAHNALYDAKATQEVFFTMLSDALMTTAEGLMMFENVVGELEDKPCDYYPMLTRARLICRDGEPVEYRK